MSPGQRSVSWRGDVHVEHLAHDIPVECGERRTHQGHAARIRRRCQLVVVHVRDDAPLLQRILAHHDIARARPELPRRLEQHVAHEAVQVGLTGEALEVATDHRVRLGKLGDALLGGALALAAHVIDQPLAMERRADHPGRGLERGELGGVDGALAARVVESHDAVELTGDEDRHDRLGLRADALDGGGLTGGTLALAEGNAATRAQLREHAGVVRLIAGAHGCFAAARTSRAPAVHSLTTMSSRSPSGAGTRLHEVHAVDPSRLADQAEDTRDRGTHIGRFQQQATGARRGGEQSLPRLQRLVDLRERLRTGCGCLPAVAATATLAFMWRNDPGPQRGAEVYRAPAAKAERDPNVKATLGLSPGSTGGSGHACAPRRPLRCG